VVARIPEDVKVVLLSTRFDELLVSEVIPYQRCNATYHHSGCERTAAGFLRKARHEGIFYMLSTGCRPGDEAGAASAVNMRV